MTRVILGSRPDLLADLRAAGVLHNAYAESLLPRVPLGPHRELSVTVRTVGELGHPDGCEVAKLFASLDLAPLELALHLRLLWKAQPRITVPCPHPGPDELSPRGFYLRDDEGGCWLRAYRASDDWVFGPEERLAVLT